MDDLGREDTAVVDADTTKAQQATEIVDRRTLCLSGVPGETVHRGDDHFDEVVRSLYGAADSTAAERFVLLKAELAQLSGDTFWSTLTRSAAHILGAQYFLVSKRVLPHDRDTAVEMPAFGEPGSCFSAVSFYFNDGDRERHTQGFDYPVQGSLCAHMKHDKVFLVPNHLADFIKDRAADFEVPVESHFAIPLNDESGRCFAHISAFWSIEGERQRALSWGFIEMLMHALEDLCVRRLLAPVVVKDAGVVQHPRVDAPIGQRNSNRIIQSLKPFARSLSHELRTPMHGVVGMLDIMHATVQEALESPANPETAALLSSLRENIETIQDSSRRAVEAADNVVQAYDFDMQVPESSAGNVETTAAVVEAQRDAVSAAASASASLSTPTSAPSPVLVPAGSGTRKRARSASPEHDARPRSPKFRIIDMPPWSASSNAPVATPHTEALRTIVQESNEIVEPSAPAALAVAAVEPPPATPGTQFTRVREVVHAVVNESLRFGGRPDSAIARETEYGEQIEVRNRGSNGHAATKMVTWSVEPGVPEEIQIDERDFAKLVSVLFLNALKFTEQGTVLLHVSLSPRSRFVVISVTDTGMGIPVDFRPYLFKAFARGDDSLTRQNEGLGLGLMVAKSLARRVGGDLVCVRSETRGAQRGSEFELRIPLTPHAASRSHTPSRTPTPLPHDRSLTPSLPELTGSSVASELHEPEPSVGSFDSQDPGAAIAAAAAATAAATAAAAATTAAAAVAAAAATAAAAAVTDQDHGREWSPRTSRNPIPSSLHSVPTGDMATPRRLSQTKGTAYDRSLAQKYPLNLMVAEDNKINRKLLVNMLGKLGYTQVHEAFDGAEAVRLMEMDRLKPPDRHIDVILMDLWMPHMDGYEATQRILAMQRTRHGAYHGDASGSAANQVRILAVTADVTDEALDRARAVGMHGIMTKPYKLLDLERLIVEYASVPKVAAFG